MFEGFTLEMIDLPRRGCMAEEVPEQLADALLTFLGQG